ncbi:hypothetical protein [Micromonospora sp. LOL_015]|uniref:hypothetical protein n=1 Tax=Micromonospora sp. LOL_015 TaxID=3345416 RepID=UPI003A8C0480
MLGEPDSICEVKLMWSYDEFVAKAELYFKRSANHDRVDDEFSLWLLLGLEFLLRAPLAKLHPSLLVALNNGDSILHANGVRTNSRTGPKSATISDVIDRLQYIVDDFGADRQADASYLVNLRNSELHTSADALRSADESWLPRFAGVARVLCSHLDVPVEDLVDKDILREASALQVKIDKEIERQVREKFLRAKHLFADLTEGEVRARRSTFSLRPDPSPNHEEPYPCPVCKSRGDLLLVPGRTVKRRFDEEDNQFVQDVIFVARSFDCPVCKLNLPDTSSVAAAGIRRVHQRSVEEDRYEGWEDSTREDDGSAWARFSSLID